MRIKKIILIWTINHFLRKMIFWVFSNSTRLHLIQEFNKEYF
ncbi:hypothetical protein [Mycoplasma phage sp.]|nr:hypothetical protein [Mycoplasma phage sp.]